MRQPGTKPLKTNVTPPGLLGRVRWALVRAFMRTVGRTSRGVEIGYRYGFDSGSMLDYIYRNRPEGRFLYGKYLDKIYLNAVGWRAIRARRDLLKEMLRAEIERNRARGAMTRLLDIAAGPGTYLQELLLEQGRDANIRVLCRDLAPEGLEEGRQAARRSSLTNIVFEQGDAFQPAPTEDSLGGPPNIIVVSGLYEQFHDDDLVRRSLTTCYGLLEAEGAIFFTTEIHHPMLEFVANVMVNREKKPWLLKCRPVEQVEEWARAAGFRDVESRFERVGLFTVTTGRK